MADATDAAQKLAEEKGVDLTQVEGSGAEGRVTKEDVETAAQKFPVMTNPDIANLFGYKDAEGRNYGPDFSSAQYLTSSEFEQVSLHTYDDGVPYLIKGVTS